MQQDAATAQPVSRDVFIDTPVQTQTGQFQMPIAMGSNGESSMPITLNGNQVAQAEHSPMLGQSMSLQDLLPNMPSWAGLLEPGSHELENNPWEGRPDLQRPDNNTSTITIGLDGDKTAIIPTVVDGIQLSNEEAIQRFKQTQQHFGVFDSQAAADKYDEQMHKEHGFVEPNNVWGS